MALFSGGKVMKNPSSLLGLHLRVQALNLMEKCILTKPNDRKFVY